MIIVEHEPEELINDWIGRFVENCYFCGTPTRYWHNKTNTPVCQCCAITHDREDIKKPDGIFI